jgi:hypothetical protein
LVFSGVDNSQHVIKSVSDSLKNLRTAVVAGKQDLRQERSAYSDSISVMKEKGRQERLLSQDFKAQHSNFFRTVDTLSSVGHVATRVTSIFQGYNIMQLRLRDVNKEVTESQRRLNEAMSQYGAGSMQARREMENYNKALESQKQIQSELPAQYLSLGLSALYAARPIGELTKKAYSWIATAKMARVASGATMGTGALSNMVLGGATGASLLGSGKLGRAGSLLGKGGLFGAAAIGGFAGGVGLGGEMLKLAYGEKEGERRFKGIKEQLGIDKIENMFSGESNEESILRENSISVNTINIYTNDPVTGENLKRSIQQETRRNSEG